MTDLNDSFEAADLLRAPMSEKHSSYLLANKHCHEQGGLGQESKRSPVAVAERVTSVEYTRPFNPNHGRSRK